MRAFIQVDVSILNEKVVIGLTLSDLPINIVIVQCNKTRYLINCLQIERFFCFVVHNIVIFPAQHSCIQKKKERLYDRKTCFPSKMEIAGIQVQVYYIIIGKCQ